MGNRIKKHNVVRLPYLNVNLDAVACRGAFGAADWAATWTNFNPQTY